MNAPMVRCSACGAALPIFAGPTSRCLYCGLEQPLPANIQRPLAALEDQRRSVDEAFDKAKTHADEYGYVMLFVLALQIPSMLILILSVGGIALMFLVGAIMHPSPRSAMEAAFYGLACCPTPFYIGVPLAAWWGGRRSAKLRLAALQLGVPSIDNGALSVACPKCGASPMVQKPDGITLRCGHCATECLAPLPMVQQSLRKRYEQSWKIRAEAATIGQKVAVDANRAWIRALIVLLTVSGVATLLIFAVIAIFTALE